MESHSDRDVADRSSTPGPAADTAPVPYPMDFKRQGSDLAETVQRLNNELFEVKSDLAETLQRLNNELFEVKNVILHVAGLVENTATDTRSALERVTQDAIIASLGRVLAVEARLARGQAMAKPAVPRPRPHVTFEAALEQARADFPRQFDDWQQRLWAAERAIAESVVGNVAHAGDPYSLAFKSFVEIHVRGAVLDIGCGPLGCPFYLSGLDRRRLWGVEPIVQRVAPLIPVVRGIGECLPWEDRSFDAVISATSIDHALSLERSLAEIARVLTEGGLLLMWIGSVPNAPRYDPASADYAPADAYHLFHLDKTWFEPLLLERFAMEDRIVVWRQSHEHVFYRLRRAPR